MLRIHSLVLSAAVATALATICTTALAAETASPPAMPPGLKPGTEVFVPPPPPGKLVDVGGRKLHIFCKGSGPAVIFEAGLSQFTASSTYGKAQDLIAPFAQACVYDRAGYGWSDPVPLGRTHEDMVQDLHRLLAAAGIKGPYVLVGHSMGGMLARLYVQRYRSEVAGVVLADASSEATLFAPGAAAERAALAAKIDDGLKTSKPHVPVISLPAGTAPDVFIAFTPEVFRTMEDENLAIDRAPKDMQGEHGYGTLGDIPLIVIRRGKEASPPGQDEIAWRAAQEKLATLSSNSMLIVAENSGHVIPYDQPEIVADAVKRVLTAIANKSVVSNP